MFLNAQMHELLLRLDRAKLDTKDGEGWVSANDLADIPASIRGYAHTRRYIEGKGSKFERQYKITTQGRTMLAKNAEANLAVMDKIENGFVPEGDPIEEQPQAFFPGLDAVIRPGHAPNGNGAGIVNSLVNRPTPAAIELLQKNTQAAVAATPLPPYARACVQAVEILGEDFPEVGDLVEALMKINSRKGPARE